MILLSIFILASCQKEEVPDINYFACSKNDGKLNSLVINTLAKSMTYESALYNITYEDDIKITGKCDRAYGCSDIEITFNKISGVVSFSSVSFGTNMQPLEWDNPCEPTDRLMP